MTSCYYILDIFETLAGLSLFFQQADATLPAAVTKMESTLTDLIRGANQST